LRQPGRAFRHMRSQTKVNRALPTDQTVQG
jgi:hypothetical protein